jgi:Uma2 family endonuclease
MFATSKRIRFTVQEYFRMSEAGVFDGKRVELIEGRIVRVHAQAHPHRWSLSRAMWAFRRRFPSDRFWVVVQGTLPLGRFSAPDPDIHVFDVPEGTAEEQLPKPFVVVEISDTTYRKDSGPKLRQYASNGIRDYWIVNLKQRRIEVYRKPENRTGKRKDWRYAEVLHFRAGQKIKLLDYPKVSIAVNEIIP